jgi:hypothetical protein
MSFFFFSQNQRIGGQNKSCFGGSWFRWEGEEVGKVYRRVNMVQILCTHICTIFVNGKMIPIETIPGMGGREIKKNGRGGEFNYDIFEIL